MWNYKPITNIIANGQTLGTFLPNQEQGKVVCSHHVYSTLDWRFKQEQLDQKIKIKTNNKTKYLSIQIPWLVSNTQQKVWLKQCKHHWKKLEKDKEMGRYPRFVNWKT